MPVVGYTYRAIVCVEGVPMGAIHVQVLRGTTTVRGARLLGLEAEEAEALEGAIACAEPIHIGARGGLEGGRVSWEVVAP